MNELITVFEIVFDFYLFGIAFLIVQKILLWIGIVRRTNVSI